MLIPRRQSLSGPNFTLDRLAQVHCWPSRAEPNRMEPTVTLTALTKNEIEINWLGRVLALRVASRFASVIESQPCWL